MKTCKRGLHQYQDHERQCPECKTQYGKQYHKKHKKKLSEQKTQWRRDRPGYGRRGQLKFKYGISQTDFDKLLAFQDEKCAICRKKEAWKRPRTDNVADLVVDHDHRTDKIRGLLCRACNLALGYINDDRNVALNIIVYLDSHKAGDSETSS